MVVYTDMCTNTLCGSCRDEIDIHTRDSFRGYVRDDLMCYIRICHKGGWNQVEDQGEILTLHCNGSRERTIALDLFSGRNHFSAENRAWLRLLLSSDGKTSG